MISTLDLTAVVQRALIHGCKADGALLPAQIPTVALHIAQFLSLPEEKTAATMAGMVNEHGLRLHDLLIIWQIVQAMHLRYNAPCEVLETARRMSDLIEQFVEQQMLRGAVHDRTHCTHYAPNS